MALYEQVRVAVAELLTDRNFTLPLDSLPLTALSRRQELENDNRATDALQRQTAGVDELRAVPHARVQATAHANIALNTLTDITFDAEVFDQGDMWNVALPKRITIPRTGLYLVQGNMSWGINAAGAFRLATIRLNGGAVLGVGAIAARLEEADDGAIKQNLSTLYRFVRGDYITLAVYADQTTAVPIDDPNGDVVLSACWLSNYTPEALHYAPGA